MTAAPPRRAFDLRALDVFLAVGDTGSMTAAARALGTTQPAVSQTVRRLEARLGALLIDRGARPLAVTPAGEELRARGRRLLADAERLQAAVRDVAEATPPSVRIGLIDSFAATAGPALIRGLRGHAGSLTVWSGISPALGDDLLRRRLDFIVTTDPMDSLGGLERHRLIREPFVLVLSPRLAGAGQPPALDELARHHAFVRYSERSLIGAEIERHLRRLGMEVPRSLEFDGSESLFAMVSAGLGWAITTPLCMIHGRAGGARFTAAPLPGPSLERSVYVLCRSGEFGALSARLVAHGRDVLAALVRREVRRIAPWAEKDMKIG